MANDALKSLLLPVDFSKPSRWALERALHLNLAPKAKLTLVHVVPDDIPGKLRKQALEEAERQLEALLEQARPTAEAVGLAPNQFVIDVLEGNTTKQLLKRARTVEADAICMGRHGRRPIADFVLGSTARRVLRAGEFPVLLVNQPPTRPWAHVLAAIDGTRASVDVLEAAVRFKDQGARVTAFTGVRTPVSDFAEAYGTLATSFTEQARAEAEADAKAALKASGVKADLKVLVGDPRILVLEVVKHGGVDLVVVRASTKKRLERLFLGSVAEWVLTRAPCDVLVAH